MSAIFGQTNFKSAADAASCAIVAPYIWSTSFAMTGETTTDYPTDYSPLTEIGGSLYIETKGCNPVIVKATLVDDPEGSCGTANCGNAASAETIEHYFYLNTLSGSDYATINLPDVPWVDIEIIIPSAITGDAATDAAIPATEVGGNAQEFQITAMKCNSCCIYSPEITVPRTSQVLPVSLKAKV